MASPMAMASPSGAEVVVVAEVVAVDVAGRTVTLRDRGVGASPGAAGASPMAAGAEQTLSVDPAALAALDALNAGDPVDVTCRTMVAPAGTMGASPGMATITSCSSVIAIVPTGSPAPGGMSPQP